MDSKLDLSLDEIIAFNKRQKSSRGGGARGRGRRGSGRGTGGSGFGQKSAPGHSTTVQTVRKAAQQNARQASKRARINLLNRKRNIAAYTDDQSTTTAPPGGGGRGAGRGRRARGRGKQPQGPVATAGRGRGITAGRGTAVGRGRGIGTRIKRTATEGFVTVGKIAQQQQQQQQQQQKKKQQVATQLPATQRSNRGRKRLRQPQQAPIEPIQISVVQDIENEPVGVELPSRFAIGHHTTRLLNDRFMPVESVQKVPKRLVLPNGRSIAYQD